VREGNSHPNLEGFVSSANPNLEAPAEPIVRYISSQIRIILTIRNNSRFHSRRPLIENRRQEHQPIIRTGSRRYNSRRPMESVNGQGAHPGPTQSPQFPQAPPSRQVSPTEQTVSHHPQSLVSLFCQTQAPSQAMEYSG